MKVWIDVDERYPDWSVEDKENSYGREAEMTEEEYKDYCRVAQEYDVWQKRLQKLYRLPNRSSPPAYSFP